MPEDRLNHKKLLLKLVIPESLKATVLRDCHNISISGHLGIKRTYKRLLESYYWPGMYKNVR